MLIKDLRKRKRLTQTALAELMHLPYQSIQKWEKGLQTPTTRQIPALAQILDVSVETLLSEFSGKIPGNTSSVTTQLYELVYELPLISNVNPTTQTIDPKTATKAIIKGTYKVLMPLYELNDKHVVIQIQGDAMSPEIKHGAFVLAEAIDSAMFTKLPPGVYAVLYMNGFVVNRIRQNDLEELGRLTLHSDNEKFGSVVIPEGDLLGMWKVIMKVQERVS